MASGAVTSLASIPVVEGLIEEMPHLVMPCALLGPSLLIGTSFVASLAEQAGSWLRVARVRGRHAVILLLDEVETILLDEVLSVRSGSRSIGLWLVDSCCPGCNARGVSKIRGRMMRAFSA